MKQNQTMMAVGAVVAILLAIGVLVYFLKPAPQVHVPASPIAAPPTQSNP